MIVKNPTKEDITVQLKGVKYTVKAQDSLEGVPEEQAVYWKRQLHNFITLSAEKKVQEVKEEKEEIKEEVKEEVKEGEVEEEKEEVKEEKSEKKSLKEKIKKVITG